MLLEGVERFQVTPFFHNNIISKYTSLWEKKDEQVKYFKYDK